MRQQSSIINIKISLAIKIIKPRSERKSEEFKNFATFLCIDSLKRKFYYCENNANEHSSDCILLASLLLSRVDYFGAISHAPGCVMSRGFANTAIGYVRNRATPAFLDGLDKRDLRVHVLARFAARNEINWCLWNEGDSARLFA